MNTALKVGLIYQGIQGVIILIIGFMLLITKYQEVLAKFFTSWYALGFIFITINIASLVMIIIGSSRE